MPTTPLKCDDNASLEQLIQSFQAKNVVTQKHRLRIEKQKLAILKVAEKQLKSLLHQSNNKGNKAKDGEPKPPESRFKYLSRRVSFYFLLIFGLFQDIAGSYIFSSTLFALIPGITLPGVIIASICYTFLDSILFYAFEVSLLKDALGIPHASTDTEALIHTYEEQISLTKSLHDELSSMHVLELETLTFERFQQLTQLSSEDLHAKHQSMGEYQESTLKKIFKYALLSFGALSSIAASYFWADSILGILGGGLIGTPVGWGLIALTIIAGLGYYYAMGGTSMIQLVNPDYEAFQTLKISLSDFQEHSEDHLERISQLRQAYFKQPTAEKAIQTDPIPEPYTLPGLTLFPLRSILDVGAVRVDYTSPSA